jgi:hypothetical protein
VRFSGLVTLVPYATAPIAHECVTHGGQISWHGGRDRGVIEAERVGAGSPGLQSANLWWTPSPLLVGLDTVPLRERAGGV